MSNQRPPGGLDGPTHDPERERRSGDPQGPAAPQAWADPNRTQRYSGRRSIVDRLRQQSREPDTLTTAETAEPPPEPAAPRPNVASSAGMRAVRGGGALRLGVVLMGVVVLGLAGGAAAAWFSGWRPGFLGGTPSEPGTPSADRPSADKPAPDKPASDKPSTQPETKPPDPAAPTAPPAGEIPKSCFSGTSEVKPGGSICGFALDPAGALSFQGQRIAERIAAGGGPAQRLVLYPFSPSGRFVFLRACETASGGRCEVQRLVDTKQRKIFEVKGGADGFSWVAWSPKEQVGLLGYRDGISETIAAIATAEGKVVRPSAIRTAKNRYALVRAGSVRWRDEEAFSVEVKLCPVPKGRGRNADCEKDDDVKYRRRTVKLER